MSRVDVVVPCYKYGHYLRDCVISVLSDGEVDARVLIIDDCSPDDSAEVAAQIAKEDSRVEFRRHTRNKGHIDTYNEGLLDWVRSEYCLLLSADDMLTPGALGRAVRVLREHPDVVMAHGSAVATSDPTAPGQELNTSPGYRITSGDDFLRETCRAAKTIVWTPTAVCRTSAQKRVGGYRRDLPHSGDLEMWLRFGATGDIAYLEADQAFYRVHASNMSQAYRGIRDLRATRAAFDAMFVRYGLQLENTRELRALLSHHLADHAFDASYHASVEGNFPLSREYLGAAVEWNPAMRWQRRYWRARTRLLLGPAFMRRRNHPATGHAA